MDEHDWSRDRMVGLVRRSLTPPRSTTAGWFRRSPVGPCTGEVCETPEQWAVEIVWDLDEAIGTREIEGGDRRVETDGVVLVRWWNTESWSR